MQLNPIMESFYLSILDYSGLSLCNNVLVNKSEKLGDFTINDKEITLPYLENLKNPDNKEIFHLLNENYVKPETKMFNMFKKRLTLDINCKLLNLFISLVNVSSSVELQNKIKNTKLIELITSIGETDLSVIESLINIAKYSRKENEESFLLDIYLRKNGEIKEVPYAAIGKVNFLLHKEVNKALHDKEKDYRVYDHKVRKKDLLVIDNLFNVVFPGIEKVDDYSEGTDNKIFRFLNILLSTSYLITNRINEIAGYLKGIDDETLGINDILFSHDWTSNLEDLYKMSTEIRLIPNQTDISKEIPAVKRLNMDESSCKTVSTDNTPVQQQQQQQSQAEPVQQLHHPMPPAIAQQPVNNVLTAEDVLRNMNRPNFQQQYVQPQQMQQHMQQNYLPNWITNGGNQQQQPMNNGMNQQPMNMGNQMPYQYPNQQQQMYQQQRPPQQFQQQFQQQPMNMGMNNNQPMNNPQYQQQGYPNMNMGNNQQQQFQYPNMNTGMNQQPMNNNVPAGIAVNPAFL